MHKCVKCGSDRVREVGAAKAPTSMPTLLLNCQACGHMWGAEPPSPETIPPDACGRCGSPRFVNIGTSSSGAVYWRCADCEHLAYTTGHARTRPT